MRIYTIHISDPDPDTSGDPAADPVPIKEGFCWPALVFSLFWALWHRLWLVALGLVCTNALLTGALIILGADPVTNGAVNAGYALLLGLFGNDLRRWTLERNGMKEAGVALGRTEDEALERYLRDNEQAAPPPASPAPPVKPAPSRLPRSLAGPSYMGVA